MSKIELNFEFNPKNVGKNSNNTNFSYKALYAFMYAKDPKFDADLFRKKVQKSKLESDDYYALIMSGFLDENKNNPKLARIQPEIDAFIAKHRKAPVK